MKLKALFGGKLEQWRWSRRRGEVRQFALFAALILSLVMLRNSELYDLREAYAADVRLLQQCSNQVKFSALPDKVFVFNARTPDELAKKMFDVSQFFDLQRLRIFTERDEKK